MSRQGVRRFAKFIPLLPAAAALLFLFCYWGAANAVTGSSVESTDDELAMLQLDASPKSGTASTEHGGGEMLMQEALFAALMLPLVIFLFRRTSSASSGYGMKQEAQSPRRQCAGVHSGSSSPRRQKRQKPEPKDQNTLRRRLSEYQNVVADLLAKTEAFDRMHNVDTHSSWSHFRATETTSSPAASDSPSDRAAAAELQWCASLAAGVGSADAKAGTAEERTVGEKGARALATQLAAAARAAEMDAVEAILAVMEARSIILTAPTYCAVIGGYIRARRMLEAESWLNKLVDAGARHPGVGKPTIVCINAYIVALAKAGAVADAEYWLTRMPALGVEPNGSSFGAVIDGCARNGHAARAELWLQQMRAFNKQPNQSCYTAVIQAHAKEGDLDSAMSWIHRMEAEGLDVNMACHNSVVQACMKAGDMDRTTRWVQSMLKRGVKPHAESYNAMIESLVKGGSTEAAEELFKQMLDAGLEADQTSFSVLLGACARCHPARATALFQKMGARTAPNTVCYNIMMNLHARAGEADRALEYYKEMVSKEVPPDQLSCNTIIKAFARTSNIQGAETWYNKMLTDSSLTPDQATFSSLVSCCASVKDAARAELWMSEMAKLGIEPDNASYSSMVDVCARCGDTLRSEHWLTEMEKAGHLPSLSCYATLVHALAKAGDIHRVERVMGHVHAAADLEPSVNMYNAVMGACAKRGDFARAESWFQRMTSAGVQADVISYTTMVHACSKSNDLQGAEMWLERMREAGVEANSVTYNTVINACARASDPGRAELWLSRMAEVGLRPGVLTYNSVINACVKAGDADRAEGWLKTMGEENVRPDAISYSTMIQACVKSENPLRSEDYMKEMLATGERPSSFSYNTVIQACCSAGKDAAKAVYWLDRALEAHIELWAKSFEGVIRVLVRSGDLEKAHSYLEIMINYGVGYGSVCLSVASAWEKVGRPARATAARRLAEGLPEHEGSRSLRRNQHGKGAGRASAAYKFPPTT